MLPDVVRDNVTDAARRQGVKHVEQIFFNAAVQAGFPQPADRAMALYRVWCREGYNALPEFCKDYVLRVNNGEAA